MIADPNELERLAAALDDRYAIDRELGRGGMATVYLARDLKHDRPVAVKVLHPDLAATLGSERFLAEIRTTANLQHPHILPLHDSGEASGFLFYVMPFVEGETLRGRMEREGPLPIEDAVRTTREVLSALDYAHRHSVVHRDIKPENILLHDGSALVADFGIALAVQQAGGTRMTQTGLSLGTPSYMSPEQAMGERNVDGRADVYATSAVLYEMLTGDPPFTGSSVQAIVAKVMTERPTPPSVVRDTVPPTVEQAVIKALSKLPADRFATAAAFRDALDLSNTATSPAIVPNVSRANWPTARPVWLPVAIAGCVVAVLAATAVGYMLHRAPGIPRYAQKTFNNQPITGARFAPDGKTLVYSTAEPRDLRVVRPDYPEPQSLGVPNVQLLAVSSKGELAVLTHPTTVNSYYAIGTLARMPLGGGAPRELIDSVGDADWSPDGSQLAIARYVGGKVRLEYPVGKVLFETAGWIADIRVSPDGKSVAFADRPLKGDTRGTIAVIDASGRKTTLTTAFNGTLGLAWSRDGKELFFSARDTTHQNVVFGVTIRGAVREALNGPGDLIVRDVAPTGGWLLDAEQVTSRGMLQHAADSAPRFAGRTDYDWKLVLSGDGKLLALSDASAEGGLNYAIWLRSGSSGRLARIGEGWPIAFSRDGRSLLAIVPSQPSKLMVYATGAGAERRIPTPGFETLEYAEWTPDETAVLVCGVDLKKSTSCLVQDLNGASTSFMSPAVTQRLAGGALNPVSPPSISPDGRFAFVRELGGVTIVNVGDGSVRRALPLASKDRGVARWSPDGRALWVVSGESPELDRIDVASGARTVLIPRLVTAVLALQASAWVFADDAHTFAFTAGRSSSDLFVVNGVR